MKLIAMTLIKNQEPTIIKWLKNYKLAGIDEHVFLDNNSTDSTVKLIKNFSIKNNYKILLESSNEDFARNEQWLRNKLYELVRKIANDGDWIIAIDSDEYIDAKEFSEFKEKYLINNNLEANSFSFNLLDMWDEKKFRTDGLWSPSRTIYLFKYENKPYAKKIKHGLHIGRLPYYVNFSNKNIHTNIIIRHYSFDTIFKREYKYNYYVEKLKNDKKNKTNYKHAISIKDDHPNLENINNHYNKTVVICSLIHNREYFLKYFLQTVGNIDYDNSKLSYYFIVNNCSNAALSIIKKFEKNIRNKNINIKIDVNNFDLNVDKNHSFDNDLLVQMAKMRNMCIQYGKSIKADYVLSIDSDILVPPFILKQLILRNKPIISPTFYSRWCFKNLYSNSQVSDFKGKSINNRWSTKVEEVGFLGAFTLINLKYIDLEKVNYNGWKNNSFSNFEDRNFCTKCSINNIDLFADNAFDIIHIDSEKDFNYYLKRNCIQINEKNEIMFWNYDLKRRIPYYWSNNFLFILIYKIFQIFFYLIKAIQKCFISLWKIINITNW